MTLDSVQDLTPKTANPQLQTRWTDSSHQRLTTEMVTHPLGAASPGGITAEMLYVPMHGSFWLSTHPDAIHPRRQEFLAGGAFTFGNGGVGRVVATNMPPGPIQVGDIVAVFGHVPCDHHDCYACGVLHRYTECDYGEGKILGHGKGAAAGTFAKYCHLPPYSYEVCFKRDQTPSSSSIQAMMYAFLVADVRNALTRHPDTLRSRRMLLIGAGMSGHLAAYIHARSCPQSQILVVDPSADRLRSIQAVAPESIATYQLPEDVALQLAAGGQRGEVRGRLLEVIADLQQAMQNHFQGRTCNLLFDCSSGNTTPLWDNRDVLAPTCHAIPFGFGSESIVLDRKLIQCSGLNILMSRGVGNIRNRRETVELIRAGASEIINRLLVDSAIELNSMAVAAEFVHAQQHPPKPLHMIPPAILAPSGGLKKHHESESGDSRGRMRTLSKANPLEIEHIEITPIALADPPLLNAAGLHAPWALRIIVQIHGRGGQIGLAELPGSTATLKALRQVAPVLTGKDARQIHPMIESVNQILDRGQTDDSRSDKRGDKPWDGRSRVHVHSALDVACLDLTARHYGTRVCDLLGGPVRDAVPFAGYLFFKFNGVGGALGPSAYPRSTGWRAAVGREAIDPDGLVAQAIAMVGEFGFRSLKLKAGILEPQLEVNSLLALREHFGPSVPLRIDPNAVWSLQTAIKMTRQMEHVLEYLEDPVRSQETMAEMRKHTSVPLATNMCTTSFDQLPDSLRLASEDIILSDHHFWGGLRPSLDLARWCATFGRGYSMHSNSHAGVSLAAMTHLAVCLPKIQFDLDTHYPWQMDDIIVGEKLAIVDGQVRLPDGPGLGIELDPVKLQKAADDYDRCGLTDRDDEIEIRKHWPDWKFQSVRY